MAKVDRAATVAKGSKGRAIMSPAQMGLLFHSTPPALAAATISKMRQWAKLLATMLRPSLALRHACCPITPRHSYLPKAAKGGRERCSTIVWVAGFQ
jgi:hypothetical protein